MGRGLGSVVGVVATLIVGACSAGRAELAAGVTKEGLQALQLGMSEEQVRGILGAPLGEDRKPERVLLEYARKPSGFLISVVFHEDNLQLAVVIDARSDKNCSCRAASCPDTWLDKCATQLPSRP